MQIPAVSNTGIVPPWLRDDNYLPVLPLPPGPPDWDLWYKGPPVDDGVPDPDDRDFFR